MRPLALAALALCLFVCVVPAQGGSLQQRMPAPVWHGLLCIHHYEGAWDAHTGNGYYGGLQMDRSFMARHGGWIYEHHGTADHWKPATQLLVAWRAYRSGRGFAPWPHTSRLCGLRP